MMKLLIPMTLVLLAACSEPANNDGGADTGETTDTTPVADMDKDPDVAMATPDMGSAADMERVGDQGTDADTADETPLLMEMEPNDGTTVDEVNDLAVGQRLAGVVELSDSDIFRVATEPGGVYEVVLESARLAHHITVIDNGRGGDDPAQDYVKIARGETLQFVSMGEGGHLVVVRDAGNVDGGMVGGPEFTYELEVRELDPADVTQGPLTLGNPISGTLDVPTDVHVWTFDGTAGMDVVFDMSMPTGDGRLYVVATATGDWIARQDNRAIDDPNPFLDAPLTESGGMWLIVEDITEAGPASSYSIQTGP